MKLALAVPFTAGPGWPARLARLRECAARWVQAPDEITVGELPRAKWNPGRARMLAVEHSSADVVALMDADCLPRPDLWVRLRAMFAAPGARVVCASVMPCTPAMMDRLARSDAEWPAVYEAAQEQHAAFLARYRAKAGEPPPLDPQAGLIGAGALLAARREHLTATGVMLPGRYAEEVAVVYRLRAAGCDVRVLPWAVAHENWPGDRASRKDMKAHARALRELRERYGG